MQQYLVNLNTEAPTVHNAVFARWLLSPKLTCENMYTRSENVHNHQ